MNKNTSPQSRPRNQARGRGTRTASPSAARVASKVTDAAKARRAPGPTTMAGRIRRMLMVVGVPHAVLILTVTVVALAALLLSSSPVAWLPTIVAESWMVFNLAPVRADDIVISLLPILPAAGLAFLVGRRIRKAVKDKVSVNDLLVLSACVLAIPLLLTVIAWLMLWDAGKVYDVQPPNFFAALPRMFLLHLVALAGGMGTRLWKALAKRYGVSPEVIDAVRTALRFLKIFLLASAAVYALTFAIGWARQSQLFDQYPTIDAAGIASLVLLSLLYLPNAIVGTSGVLAGSDINVGEGSFSLFSTHMVPLPPLPVAAALPAEVHPWAPALLVVAIASALYVAYRVRPSFLHVALAATAVLVLMAVLAYFTGGALGFYDYVGLNILSAAALTAAWFALAGAAVAAALKLTRWRTRRTADDAPAGTVPDYDVDNADAAVDSTGPANDGADDVDAGEPDVDGPDSTGVEVDADAETADAQPADATVVDAEVDAEVGDGVETGQVAEGASASGNAVPLSKQEPGGDEQADSDSRRGQATD